MNVLDAMYYYFEEVLENGAVIVMLVVNTYGCDVKRTFQPDDSTIDNNKKP